MKTPEREKQVCRACVYGIGFLVVATLTCIAFAVWVSNGPDACPANPSGACPGFALNGLVFGPFGILLIGSLGAAIQTFQAYRKGNEYQQWHIVMWLLLVCMITYVGFAAPTWAGA